MKYQEKDVFVSTICAFDTGRYETTVSHPSFNNNELIIVAEYDSESEAESGHEEWIEKMTAKELPEQIEDVSTCAIAMFAYGDDVRMNKKKE